MTQYPKIEDRTYQFALRIIRLVRALPKEYSSRPQAGRCYVLALASARMSRKPSGASTKRDFANKMAVAQKEARETHYWWRLIRDSDIVTAKRIAPLIQEALEIKKILSKTVSTTRRRLAGTAQ